MKQVRVECQGIALSYGATPVLRDVHLDIAPGEFFALLGPSGSGKSTLLRLLAGFQRQQQGRVLIDGQDIGHLEPWQRQVGMVFQSYALWPHLSVWDNVAFGLVERRVKGPALDRRVGAALELVGLSGLAERRPGQLSGGQQQRVALARTVVTEPQVLLLDEPLSNLDKTLRVQMREELLALQRRLGMTTIFVTHDQEEAMGTADRMAVLDHGVVQQVGTPQALYDAPANAFVAQFVGTMNQLPAQRLPKPSGTLRVAVDGLGEFTLAEPPTQPSGTGPLVLGLRPHALRLQGSDTAVGEADDCAWGTAQVHSREFLGAMVRYQLQLGPHRLQADALHLAGQALLPPGQTVRVGVPLAQLRVLQG